MVPGSDYAVVIPTLGRPSLAACLAALASASGPPPVRIVLADDRSNAQGPLPVPAALVGRTTIVTPAQPGPAAARNAGWRAAGPVEWIVFLDDDVRVQAAWPRQLSADLAGLPYEVVGVQGVIEVPRPAARRLTEWERDTVALETSWWVTADMAYRRIALELASGFDERFGTFREDSDLALRMLSQGWELRRGRRRTSHPIRPPTRWPSLRAQARHAGDAAMTHLHGRGWRARAGEGLGPRPAYAGSCTLAAASAALLVAGRPRAATLTAASWLGLTAGLAGARIRPGPRTLADMAEMSASSVLIPPLAVGHWLAGWWRWRKAASWPPPGPVGDIPVR